MKKLITICLLLATTFAVNAQTEAETKNWLTEKLSRYIVWNNYTVDFKNEKYIIGACEITINYEDRTNNKIQIKIPTDGITFNTEGISTTGDRISKRVDNGPLYFDNETDDFILKEGETDLRARVKKALDHLATFCPKKKEAF